MAEFKRAPGSDNAQSAVDLLNGGDTIATALIIIVFIVIIVLMFLIPNRQSHRGTYSHHHVDSGWGCSGGDGGGSGDSGD